MSIKPPENLVRYWAYCDIEKELVKFAGHEKSPFSDAVWQCVELVHELRQKIPFDEPIKENTNVQT